MKRTILAPYIVCISIILVSTILGFEYSKAQVKSIKTYKFVNGNWFNGSDFESQVLYSLKGFFTKQPLSNVDEVIDLKGGFVVPPFGDAHNHYISGPYQIDSILRQYMTDGIFYVKNPASINRDTAMIQDKINIPESVDVVFSNAGLTATGGHPVLLYEQHLRKVKKPGPDGTFENLAYFIVDNQKDLETKWPTILAGRPDFIKTHLLYSEEFEKRRDDPAYHGHKGQDPELLPFIVKKAHENKLRVSCHIETAGDFRSAVHAGVDEINHLPGYYPDFNHPDWFLITQKDAEAAASNGIYVVTTIYVSAAEIKEPEQLKRAQQIQAQNLQMLRKAGVKLAIGPDVHGVTSIAEIMSLHNLNILDNRTLLKMWCETTPETIFPGRKIGRLKEGFEASFVVLGENPILDFEKVRDIKLRFKQGYPILIE